MGRRRRGGEYVPRTTSDIRMDILFAGEESTLSPLDNEVTAVIQ